MTHSEEAESVEFPIQSQERREMETYRCQFCGQESPKKEWKDKGQTCPKCDRKYDWMLAWGITPSELRKEE